MSALTMPLADRWRFLAESTVAVVAAHHGGESVAVPIWIEVRGESVLMVTPRESEKARVMLGAGRAWVTAHTTEAPHRFVAGEGAVVLDETVDLPELVRSMSHRSLGGERGAEFARSWLEGDPSLVVLRVTPDRWRSMDETRGEA
ncbi:MULTISPECIES: hypothetical protein [unclassified Agrococcus]|uniref:hypothetical protein n=1 Tax=unclassified Agrococcus TaxID=2615065 RepID=UPI003623C297